MTKFIVGDIVEFIHCNIKYNDGIFVGCDKKFEGKVFIANHYSTTKFGETFCKTAGIDIRYADYGFSWLPIDKIKLIKRFKKQKCKICCK